MHFIDWSMDAMLTSKEEWLCLKTQDNVHQKMCPRMFLAVLSAVPVKRTRPSAQSAK